MTAKEYLSQTWMIEQNIKSRLKEIDYWRKMADSISAPDLEEHYNPNKAEEASYVHCLEMIDMIQEEVGAKTAEMLELRNQINRTIDTLDDYTEQMLLRLRYIEHMSFKDIGRIMHLSERSVFRIHERALKKDKIFLKVGSKWQ